MYLPYNSSNLDSNYIHQQQQSVKLQWSIYLSSQLHTFVKHIDWLGTVTSLRIEPLAII